GAGQLVLPEREEEIALVFARVASALEQRASRRGGTGAWLQAREMAGGDVLRAKLVGAVNEAAELEILVAHHAGIGRAARLVFVGKVLNDLGLKFKIGRASCRERVEIYDDCVEV